MRLVIFLLIVAIIVVIAAVATGFVNVRPRGGESPQVTVSRNSVSAKGGQPPAFDVETGSVKVGSKPTTVRVPTLEIQKAGHNQAAAATNNAM